MRKLLSVVALAVVCLSISVWGEQLYQPGKLIVMLDQGVREQVDIREVDGVVLTGVPSLDGLNRQFGVQAIDRVIVDEDMDAPAKSFGLDLIFMFSFPDEVEITRVSEIYGKDPAVLEAIRDQKMEHCFTPNDPMLGSQWGLTKTEAFGAWDIEQGDSSAVVAIIDDGLDWNHVDLYDNYVGGWDFVNGDPDPTPAPGDFHGTHCAGIASAVTNNSEGVASLGFSCGLMGLRTYYCSQCVTAIYYAADNGADVISMSWGCPQMASMEAALNYSQSMGLVNCAAAGNDNSTAPHYPSYYGACVAVAASDVLDMKADFSNYGDWIEVCAPGTSIWSTVPGDGYSSESGTSMACPFAAGLFALLYSQFPDSSNNWLKILVYSTCDSMPDPLYPSGLLGFGRINAFKAVGTRTRCWLELVDFTIIDTLPGCDNDGRAEAGETVELVCTLSNRAGWRDANGVSGTISTTYPGITINTASSNFGNIYNGSAGGNSSNPFVFSVSDPFPAHRVDFTLTITATPPSYNTEDTISTMVGHPSLLLVDDDVGTYYERNFREPLDVLDVPFDEWEVVTQGAVGAQVGRYDVIVWFTGDDDTTTLVAQDITDLTNFLDLGGKLFITGQNIGEDIGADPFYANYLRASYVGNTTDHQLSGVPGDSIGDGLLLATTGGDPSNQDSEDIISPLSGTDSCFTYSPGQVAALRYDSGTYKLVYFGFGFEAINEVGPFAGRDTVLARILRWFDMSPGVEELSHFKSQIANCRLHQNFPNPFAAVTSVQFSVPSGLGDQQVSLSIYDISGRLVRNLFDQVLTADDLPLTTAVEWDGRDGSGRGVPAGVYFCRLSTGSRTETRKLAVLR